MEQSETVGKLVEALSKAQGEMTNAAKTRTNPFYKSTYADLASVIDTARKPLSSNGLSVIQLVEGTETADVVTVLAHSSGEWVRSRISLKPSKVDPQGIGSALTYARRYAYAAIIGMASEEDDDGNEASKPETKKVEVRKPEEKKSVPTTTTSPDVVVKVDPARSPMPLAESVFPTVGNVIDKIAEKMEAVPVESRNLINQDFAMPVGSKDTRGKRLRDLKEDTINKAIEYMKKNNENGKYQDAITKCEDYLEDSGLPF